MLLKNGTMVCTVSGWRMPRSQASHLLDKCVASSLLSKKWLQKENHRNIVRECLTQFLYRRVAAACSQEWIPDSRQKDTLAYKHDSRSKVHRDFLVWKKRKKSKSEASLLGTHYEQLSQNQAFCKNRNRAQGYPCISGWLIIGNSLISMKTFGLPSWST